MRRRLGPPLVITVLIGLLWMLLRSPAGQAENAEFDPQTGDGPSPMHSHQARKQSARPEAAEPTDQDNDEEFLPNHHVSIVLRDASQGILLLPRRHRLNPAEYWPLPGDAPFPEGDTAAGLQSLMQQDLPPNDPQIQDWLDLALDEDLDPQTQGVTDPWAAVLSMEVARREADLNQQLDYQQAIADGLGPQNGRIRPDALVGAPDQTTLLALASDLIADQPSHPATEFARLYALEATVQQDQPDRARQMALDMLHHTDDALVAVEAVHFLARLPGEAALAPEDLDAMRVFHESFPELMDDPDLLVMALDQAMRMDDGPRARDWAKRYEAAVAHCDNVDGIGCAGHRDNLDAALGYIGDVSPDSARDWRQGVELAGWACARKGVRVPAMGLRGKGTWQGGWSWQTWEPQGTAFEACLRQEIETIPEPKQPMKLGVSVVP